MVLETILFDVAVTGYGVAALAAAVRRERSAAWYVIPAAMGLAAHTAAITSRWAGQGHVPIISIFELVSAGSWACAATFLVLQRVAPPARAAAPWVFIVSAGLMALGAQTETAPSVLTPSLASYWLVVHVFFALIAYGLYLAGAGLAVRLVRAGGDASPQAESLSVLTYRVVLVAFVAHTLMILCGAIWAQQAWGRYWGWDPMETWSLVTWVPYAFWLHARAFLGWRPRTAGAFLIAAFALLVFSYWAVPFLAPSRHAYGVFR